MGVNIFVKGFCCVLGDGLVLEDVKVGTVLSTLMSLYTFSVYLIPGKD